MVRRLAVPIAIGSLCVGTADAFVPFADVEELRPRRLEDFCGEEGHGKVRRCSHHLKKRLDDGGDLELSWSMDVDPSRILSLDTEAEHGVRLARCEPGELELELPGSHLRHAAAGQLVVGSRFVHGCRHLGDRHLFHRVTEVRPHWGGHDEASSTTRVRLGTQELPSLAHAVPSLRFSFSWMPVEAMDEAEFPAMRTDFGANRKHLQRQRRLSVFESFSDNLKDTFKDAAAGGSAGGLHTSGNMGGQMDTDDGYLNLMPKQLSNFGWNWDFYMNTTQEPDFELDVPGAKGILKVRKPFIKVHTGLYLNFSSQFVGITMPPKVQWTWGLRGRGRVQARMLGSLNTTSDAGTDPFMAFKLPIFKDLETPRWFDKVEFATGSLPITMEPGFRCSASMYHRGTFHGAIAVGGRTHGVLNPSMSYDSLRGFETRFDGNLTDTNIWPPLWIIFTKHFEMGIVLKPSLLMRGDFSGMERATMAIEGRPYVNITVTRESQSESPQAGAAMKTLTVYPMRVTGLKVIDFTKRYKVKVSVNGDDVETSPQVNFGQVEFKDHITNFDCGQMPEQTLLSPSTKIYLSLIEVSDVASGQPSAAVIASGEVTCSSLDAGQCVPTPATVPLMDDTGLTVAAVQVAILLEANPEPWLVSRIRGMEFSFPQVIIRQETLKPAFADDPKALTAGKQAEDISLHFIRGGQSYVVPLVGSVSDDQLALAGASTLEFGPGFLDTWMPCSVAACDSPRLELWAQSTLVGSAPLPPSPSAPQGGGFMASSGEAAVPTTVSLLGSGEFAPTVALITMNTKALLTLHSSMFLSPRTETAVKLGGSQQLMWTVAGVDRSKQYAFTVQPLELKDYSPDEEEQYRSYRKVNGKVLVPVISKSSVTGMCDSMTSSGLPADQAPCTFSTELQLRGLAYKNGMVVVVQVSWKAAGTTHELFSPPLLVGHLAAAGHTAALGRRLEEVRAATPRVLFSRQAWSDRIQQHGESCQKRDLKFNLGVGLRMRGKVEGITVPQGFPMVGSGDDQPGIATGYRTIFDEEPGESAMDAFGGPSGPLCEAGLCQGALPGCSDGGPKKMHFPKLVFDFVRPFYFGNHSKGSFDGMMKQALAYAFSTMPEMIDVMIQEANKTKLPKPPFSLHPHSAHTTAAPTTTPPLAPTWWSSGEASTPAPPVQWPTQELVPPPTAAPQEQDGLAGAFNKWWGGASRRLAAGRPLDRVGDADALPETLGAHQLRLEFRQGLPFVVDRPLVELMLQNGYFVGLEDVDDGAVASHGPLAITRFYVDSGLAEGAHEGQGSARTLAAPISHGLPMLALVALVAAAVAGCRRLRKEAEPEPALLNGEGLE